MTLKNPYEILGIPIGTPIDEVKKVYKAIALKSHPDKISDINEKNKKVKEFIDATNAYNRILKGDLNDYNNDNYEDYDYNFTYEDWEETFNSIKQSDFFKDVISMINKFKSKIKKHNITALINLEDYFSNHKKKLRLFLKGIKEPVYINLDCKKYPFCIINYFDDNDNEHEINITIKFNNNREINNGFYYDNDNIDDIINLYYDLNITTIDYLIGSEKEIIFLNKEILKVKIEPFEKRFIINNYGINNGDLIIIFIYNPIKKIEWNNLIEEDKNDVIKILKKIDIKN
jgi:DnaJ-class molecular chaperone